MRMRSRRRGELGEARERLVGEPVDERIVQRLPAQEQAVEDRTVERVHGELEVGVLPDLPTGAPALESGEHGLPTRRNDVLPEASSQVGIVLEVRDEAGDDRTAGWLGEDSDQPAE